MLKSNSNTLRGYMSYSNNNKITLITLTMNSAKTLADTLNSVHQQSYKNIEHLIVDGHSTDSTSQILDEYSRKANHDIEVFKKNPAGIYNALNYGIEKASGDVIGVIHSDDYLADNNCIEMIMNHFNNTTPCVFGDVNIINNQNKILRTWKDDCQPDLRGYWWTPPHTATYIHKNLYSEYGLYDESYKISGDYDFFCRIPRNVIQQFIRIRHTLVIQRNGGISTNPMNFLKKNSEDLRIVKKYSSTPLRDFLIKKYTKIKQFRQFIQS